MERLGTLAARGIRIQSDEAGNGNKRWKLNMSASSPRTCGLPSLFSVPRGRALNKPKTDYLVGMEKYLNISILKNDYEKCQERE